HYEADLSLNFIWHSSTPHGTQATGVSHCLKFRPYLNRNYFICIDSDYRHLMQEAGFNPDNFIFQTYTYSIENHYCYLEGLNGVCEEATGLPNTIFDFGEFLRTYSRTVYEVLIWHLHFVREDVYQFPKNEFTQLISLREFVTDAHVHNNGRFIIDLLNERCREKIAQLSAQHPDLDMEAEKAYYNNLGLVPDNAYLYVRGHNLYDLICAIGTAVDEIILRNEGQRLGTDTEAIKKLYDNKKHFKQELDKHLQFDSYPEIKKIGHEIKLFFS
ncbi:MAG: DUF4435 domain-containing protein, partial [Bacteroidota bacterium]|nr:DUF4435 domain-containing protein [Bacteroidota bacterium]